MKRNRKRQRGVRNAELKEYLRILAATNKAIVNNTESQIDALVRRFNVPYTRAETIATNFRKDNR